jgi:hypothetical protein
MGNEEPPLTELLGLVVDYLQVSLSGGQQKNITV